MATPDEDVREVGSYILGETLGKGGYSWVKLGRDKKTQDEVALKFMKRADASWEQEQANQVRTEIKSMIKVKSDHVMKLYAYNLNAKYPQTNGDTLNCILLVLELCPGGELFDILYYCQQLDEVTSRTYFQQLMKGLEDCHNAGVVHRDLKPQNLLLDRNFQLKITDFGLSKIVKDPSDLREAMKTTYVGTRGFQAPELLLKQKYTRACDIFSAGVVLFILLTGYPPFNHAKANDQWYAPLTTKGKPNTKKFWRQHKGCGVPKDCQSLIESMLAFDMDKRCTLDEIKEHPWYNGDVLSPEDLKTVLKGKHKSAREKRKRDPRKQEDFRNSVKETKKRDIEEGTEEIWGPPPKKIMEDDEYENFLTQNNAFEVPMKMKDGTEVKPMNVLNNIYDYFTYSSTVKGKVEKMTEENAWHLEAKLKDNKMHNYELHVDVCIVGDNYVYSFRKIEGPVFRWHKIWSVIEQTFIDLEFFSNPNNCMSGGAPAADDGAKAKKADEVKADDP